MLGLLQEWLTREQLAGARLVVVTRGAVAAVPGEGVADLAGSAVWGLVRSAQTENPGRLALVDLSPLDGPASRDTAGVLATALASAEPELAVRDGQLRAPRLARVSGGLPVPAAPVPDRVGTVLVTGGSGSLGGLVAGHLVSGRGVRHLVLA